MDDDVDNWDVVTHFNGRPVYVDRNGQPMTLRQWSAARADHDGRLLAYTEVGEAEVVTMWMGLDADPIVNPVPLIFGSIIRWKGAYDHESEIETATEKEALEAHATLVERLRSR